MNNPEGRRDPALPPGFREPPRLTRRPLRGTQPFPFRSRRYDVPSFFRPLGLVLLVCLAVAPERARAAGPVGVGLAYTSQRGEIDDFLPRRKGDSESSLRKVFDFADARTLTLLFVAGGGLLAYTTAPEGFTGLGEEKSSPVTMGIMMGLTTLIPTLGVTEVLEDMGDECMGLVLTLPVMTFTYVLTKLVLDWVEVGMTRGNTLFPLGTGILGVGVGFLIAGTANGKFSAIAGPQSPWRFGAGPAPDGSLRLGAARSF